jgi:heme oxygenase
MITERLKTETRPHHDAIEKVSFSDKIMSGQLTYEEYKILIINNYILNSLLEKELSGLPSFTGLPGLDWEKRKKTELLKKDLEVLGLNADEIDRHGYSYLLADELDALGSFYVLEGSTLGGAVISRFLRKNENLKDVPEFHFYGCYGDQVGPNWKNFQQVLVATASDTEKEDRIVASACKTFDFFTTLFQNSLAEKQK